MCAWRAAPFLWQKDGFSCRDAHAFNRNSSSQVTLCLGSSHFRLVTRGFSVRSSPVFLYLPGEPGLVKFRFVDHISTARLLGSSLRAKTVNTCPRNKATCRGSRAGCRPGYVAAAVELWTSAPRNRNRRSGMSVAAFFPNTGPRLRTTKPASRADGDFCCPGSGPTN